MASHMATSRSVSPENRTKGRGIQMGRHGWSEGPQQRSRKLDKSESGVRLEQCRSLGTSDLPLKQPKRRQIE